MIDTLYNISWNLWFKIITINCLITINIGLFDGYYRKSLGKNRLITWFFILLFYVAVFYFLNFFVFEILHKSFVVFFVVPSFGFFLLFTILSGNQTGNKIVQNIRSTYTKGIYDFVLQTKEGADLRFSDPLDNFLIYAVFHLFYEFL